MVLSAGAIIEFDTPKLLLQNPASVFRNLAEEADIFLPDSQIDIIS